MEIAERVKELISFHPDPLGVPACFNFTHQHTTLYNLCANTFLLRNIKQI